MAVPPPQRTKPYFCISLFSHVAFGFFILIVQSLFKYTKKMKKNQKDEKRKKRIK